MEKLKISPNKRHLLTESNKPFFYLGETAWELFHRCDREEADLFLKDRASKGFNVIQSVALAEIDGINTPNSYGHQPLVGHDALKPVEAYWQHVDWIVKRTNELGMYVGFLPTWGDKWCNEPLIFTLDNARKYGEWLGKRYKNAGLIWILGGDRRISKDSQSDVIRAMAEGLRAGDDHGHLMTFHPPGNTSSSKYVHCESWVDFHMQQAGHYRDRASWQLAEFDWDLLPHRPFVNGEPPYEAHPNNFAGGDQGWLDQADVRRELYWSICGGSAGFTYGCHAIWQMWQPPRNPINGPRAPWKDSLSLPGAGQMQHGLKLVMSRPFAEREPASHLIIKSPHSTGPDTIRSCRGADGSWMLIYCPNCQRVKVDLKAIKSEKVKVTYFNPRTGASIDGGVTEGNREESFQPPFDPEGRDWVIILDDSSKNYSNP